MTINKRQRIEWRYTTCPADCGYDGRPSNWRTAKPDAIGTAGTILPRVLAEMRRHLSGGCMYRAEYTLAATGEVVNLDDILRARGDQV